MTDMNTRKKLSFKLDEWPADDRRALSAAFSKGEDYFSDNGLAVHWRPDTRAKVIKSYGAFLHCLDRHDVLDPTATARDRISRASIRMFVGDMRTQGLAPMTIASVIRDLREAIRVMCPGAPCKELILASRALDRAARPSRDQRHLLVAPSTLFYAGIKRMRRLKALAATDSIAGVEYGDGLMMAMQAVKALRLRNLSGMLDAHNIVVNQLEEYELRYEAHETKTWTRIRAPLPDKVASWIAYWLTTVRPNLLRVARRESRAMWITSMGTDMVASTPYGRFCKATKAETGKRINPHLTRKIIVTGIAIGAPEMIELAPGALDHTGRRHTDDAYNLADDLAVSRLVNDIVGRRRLAAVRRSKS